MNTSVVTWNPFKEMEQLSNRMATLWPSGTERHLNGVNGNGSSRALAAWVPPCDILEDERGYQINVDLPGFEKDSVTVSIEDARLYLKGERAHERPADGAQYHVTERPAGRFQRSFSLPDDADASKVSAEFKDGVLRIAIEKRADAKPRLINVKVK